MIVILAQEVMTEFVEEQKLGFWLRIICLFGVKKRGGRGELEAFAGLDL